MKTIQKLTKMLLLLMIIFSAASCSKDDGTLSVNPEGRPDLYKYEKEGQKMIFFIDDGSANLVGYEGMTKLIIPSKVKYKSDTWEVEYVGAIPGIDRTKDLISVVFPNTVKAIFYGAFANCRKLTSITFSEGLRSIGSEAFANNKNLITIHFPSTLRRLDNNAFSGCNELMYIIFESEVPPVINHAFIDHRRPFYCLSAPTEYINNYKNINNYNRESRGFYRQIRKFDTYTEEE